ncbi:HAD family phosphatase [Deinococcus sp. KSM4-11]|uniref:Cof-type HAD-IIB family hydrolase n=1 Tax=Deinococcus sp. KSM4-11 TaxID=2568654 RepID=UPI0010A44DBB|nr:Cof-type HAD-IIB family hydrolase [Deinococcus sp. KSM4-11]THF85275.1 HAD family phosphatase [Deinococcus sp. KSM4-11]
MADSTLPESTRRVRAAGSRPRLIATDLDGTLLRSDLSVSARTRAALDAARAAGIHVVPVTARQPRGVRFIAEQAGFTEWALCGNGAHGIHLGTGQTLFAAHVAADVQRAVALALAGRVPGTLFVSVRQGGEVFVAQAGYAQIADFQDHKREPADMGAHSLEDVLAEPSLKFIVRHPTLTPRELFPHLHALNLPGFAVTHSGAPFLEVLAEGVSKAWGLERLCAHLGVARSEVLAFGDAPNDAEMLAWAGRGVAMANADPEARDAADDVTTSNDEDGVAAILEHLL